jgi:hypothetical protein
MGFVRIDNDFHNTDLIRSVSLKYRKRQSDSQAAQFSVFILTFMDGATLEYSGEGIGVEALGAGLAAFNQWCKQMQDVPA